MSDWTVEIRNENDECLWSGLNSPIPAVGARIMLETSFYKVVDIMYHYEHQDIGTYVEEDRETNAAMDAVLKRMKGEPKLSVVPRKK